MSVFPELPPLCPLCPPYFVAQIDIKTIAVIVIKSIL